MSERLKNHEHAEGQEAPREQAERHHDKPEKSEEAAKSLNAEDVRKNLEELGDDDASALDDKLHAVPPAEELPPPNKAVKTAALNHYLNLVRSNFKGPGRSFSKLIHNQTVSSISDFAGKTIVRPYAILLGGVVTLIGSSAYLFYIRGTGYKYNFFVPLMLFAGGFVVGLLAELFLKGAFGKKRG